MKRIFLGLLLGLAGSSTAQVNYVLDLKKSAVYWEDPGHHHRGYIWFSAGYLNKEVKGMPTAGAFTLDMKSMRSTDGKTPAERKKVDDKLRSPEYFNVAKFPQATVTVKQILAEKAAGTYKVSGELRIKGISAPLAFTASLKKNGKILTAKARLSISRTTFSINKPRKNWDMLTIVQDKVVDDLIPLELDLYFVQK